jgi:hypothetical protein
MEFRWVALLSLWTLLSGPMLVQPFMTARPVNPGYGMRNATSGTDEELSSIAPPAPRVPHSR